MTVSVEMTVVIEEQTVDVSVEPLAAVDVSTLSEPFTVVTVGGPPGVQGPPGNNTQIVGEVPNGVQDGVNTTYGTAHNFVSGSTAVYRNGLREGLGYGYTESGLDAILFSEAPLPDDDIRMDYLVAATLSGKLEDDAVDED